MLTITLRQAQDDCSLGQWRSVWDGSRVCDTSDELFVNQYASALTPSPSPNPRRGEQIRRFLRFFKGEEHKQCFSPSPEIGRSPEWPTPRWERGPGRSPIGAIATMGGEGEPARKQENPQISHNCSQRGEPSPIRVIGRYHRRTTDPARARLTIRTFGTLH